MTSSEVVLQSVVTCPHCGHEMTETMPSDSCRFFHRCVRCDAVIRPKEGDCCVFCSYGSSKCPPIQQQSHCCNG
ncbi:MAG TPA: GDCCVxC domain-containing (seleno)protein [Edaphobacter sp.]|nr:GDCCVxC domain-containing (seleno)protein [Edaphobacter sp.]